MRKGYGSRSVCLSVTKLAATYLICEYQVRFYKIPYGISNACVDFAKFENVLFFSFGVICSWLLPQASTLPREFPMDRTNNSRQLSRYMYKVSSFSDSSYKAKLLA